MLLGIIIIVATVVTLNANAKKGESFGVEGIFVRTIFFEFLQITIIRSNDVKHAANQYTFEITWSKLSCTSKLTLKVQIVAELWLLRR